MVGLTGVELSSSHRTVPASSAFFKSPSASSRAPSGNSATAPPPFPAHSPGRGPLNRPVQLGSEHQAQVENEKATRNQPPSDPAPMSAGITSDLPSTTSPRPSTSESNTALVHRDRGAPWYADPVAWALAGSGVAALAVGSGLLLSASGLRDDANHASSQRERDDLQDRAGTRSLLGTTIGIGGAGLLAAGIVKLVVYDHEVRADATAWHLGISFGGMNVSGRF